ncbi:MAG TPA: DedA family protein [Candidatus Dormibacteraeota bacterium]|jgi:membrane protein DedA with SNARE-associated domain|nr:DedA family protein [Candidatus Dormibacteraeota bacterium]
MPRVRIALLAILIAAAILLVAILEGDIPDLVTWGTHWIRLFLRRYSYLGSYGLLYVEESGVPLPAPGDVFVMYVGAHVPRYLASWIIAWLGLIGIVVLGATNLFFISRKFGRRLAEGRFAEVIHLSPERLDRAERWFKRYGVAAIIFGRHIPGFRVPITVAAGVLRISFPVFAASVAVSTAIWAGVVMIIGVNFGPRMEAFLRVHRETYFLWAAVVLVMIFFIVRSIVRAHPTAPTSPQEP